MTMGTCLASLVGAPSAVDLVGRLQDRLFAIGTAEFPAPGLSNHSDAGGEQVIGRGFKLDWGGHGLVLNSGFWSHPRAAKARVTRPEIRVRCVGPIQVECVC